jgi:hypothetical protein
MLLCCGVTFKTVFHLAITRTEKRVTTSLSFLLHNLQPNHVSGIPISVDFPAPTLAWQQFPNSQAVQLKLVAKSA